LEPHLEKLIRLQEVSQAIEKLNRELAAVPLRIQDLDQSLARHRVEVAKAKDDLATHQKDRRKLEGDLQTVEAKIGKYQTQLMDVKTNKEYTAMLHEIDRAKEERDGVDTKILQEMESADLLESVIKQKEAALDEEMKQVAAAQGILKSEQQDLESKKSRMEAERKGIETEMTPELVAEFNRISRSRAGVAVARVANGLCQGCSVRIQPRVIQLIRRNEGILRCESCKRFLYYLEEERAEPPAGQQA
jgi:predicted  nucleic acid-binding Zn-ribbon protein